MYHDPAGAGSSLGEPGAGSAAASIVGSSEAPSAGVGDDDPDKREVVLALKADTDFIQSMEVGAVQCSAAASAPGSCRPCLQVSSWSCNWSCSLLGRLLR